MINFEKITVKDITAIMTVNYPKGKTTEIINREAYGISFCREGQIKYFHKDKMYVSTPEYATILPLGESYTIFGDKDGVFPVINFLCNSPLCDKIISIPIKSLQPYIADFEKINALFLFDKNRAKIMSIFYNILHRLCLEETSSSGIIFSAVKYLEENCFSADLSVAALARQCNISELYFRKLFLKQMGNTPKQYILDVRIEKAKQLLSDGVFKIGIVSEECGFSSPYHFCRIFKQKTGLTPSEYMKQNKVYKI